MKKIKLSDNFNIYKGKFTGKYSTHTFIELLKLNNDLAIHTNNNSVWIEIESPVIDEINRFVMNHITSISGEYFTTYAKHNWVYTQRKDFKMEWMHQHLQVHPPNRSKILSDYTFTYYLQVTDEIEGDEGCIVFQDENKNKHKFLPEEGDVFIFPGDLRHTAIPTPNSEKERIVFAGSFCIDIYNQKNGTKSII